MWIKRLIKETIMHEVWVELPENITKTEMALEFCDLRDTAYRDIEKYTELYKTMK